MNFTREPIIETIMSPRDGHKLVVRSSRGSGQEEYFVDALEVVSFGNALFFRSLERPKPFLVPISDYEVVEIRETRMTLKNVALDRSIKIGGGKEAAKPPKEEKAPVAEASEEEGGQARFEKKGNRRRHSRRRKASTPEETAELKVEEEEKSVEATTDLPKPTVSVEEVRDSSSVLSLLFPPPTTLISDKITQSRGMTFSKETSFSSEENVVEEKSEPVVESVPESLSEETESPEQAPFPVSGENMRETLSEEEKQTIEEDFVESSSLATSEPVLEEAEEVDSTLS